MDRHKLMLKQVFKTRNVWFRLSSNYNIILRNKQHLQLIVHLSKRSVPSYARNNAAFAGKHRTIAGARPLYSARIPIVNQHLKISLHSIKHNLYNHTACMLLGWVSLRIYSQSNYSDL